MSKMITPPLQMANFSPVQVSPINASANPHAPQAGTLNSATAPDDADAAWRRTLNPSTSISARCASVR